MFYYFYILFSSDFSYNKLKVFEINILTQFPNLESLNLEGNRIVPGVLTLIKWSNIQKQLRCFNQQWTNVLFRQDELNREWTKLIEGKQSLTVEQQQLNQPAINMSISVLS